MPQLRALLIEDSPDDAELLELTLSRGGYDVVCQRVETAAEMTAALRESEWDIVFSDYNLPSFSAPAALTLLRQSGRDVPFIVVSGTIGEEVAVAAMRNGVNDYLIKGNMARLLPAVERELRENQNRHTRRLAEETAHQLAAIVQASGDAIVSESLAGVITSWNQAAERLFGWAAAEAIGQPGDFFVPTDRAVEFAAVLARVKGHGEVERYETVKNCRNGEPIDVAVTISPIKDQEGGLVGVAKIYRDITPRKQAEEAVRYQASILRLILDQIGDGIVVVDELGKFILFNPAAKQILGRGPLDAPAHEWSEGSALWLPDGITPCPEEQLPLARTLRGEAVDQVELVVNNPKGSTPVWISITARPLMTATGELRGGVAAFRDITETRKADAELRLRDRAIQAVSQGIVICDAGQPDLPIIFASPAFCQMTGYTSAEVLGRNCRFLQGKDTDALQVTRLRQAIATHQSCTVELLNYRKDSTPFWNEVAISPVRDARQRLTHYVGVQTDVTQRRRLEEQYRQARKMDAIGQLAGGVAHDFNNLLTIINGYSELIMGTVAEDHPTRKLAEQIRKAGERSAALTRQLLTFSRQEVVAPRVLDLNQVLGDLEKMLRRIIGEDIRFSTVLTPELGAVRADPSQIEQVIMNLVVNARDAMPQGGQLTIETRDLELPEAVATAHAEVPAGSYVLLVVADTGCGMTPAVQAKIFEPFFTTKGAGKGTGLGLAVVHGIVRQSGGHVDVESKPSHGTVFKVFLPRVEPPQAARKSGQRLAAAPRGSETLLLVEDEDSVRTLTRHVLAAFGYEVLEAAEAGAALRIAATHPQPIHLLITDVVMPGLGGRLLAEKFVAQRPETKVLYLSGYTDDAIVRHGILHDQVSFLQKPYSPIALAHKVRAVLDGAEISGANTRAVSERGC